jgi:hypothetical protein
VVDVFALITKDGYDAYSLGLKAGFPGRIVRDEIDSPDHRKSKRLLDGIDGSWVDQ